MTAQWEVVIGLETHTQLSTAAKIFSGASTHFGAPPNTNACAVDIALPGVLPVLNKAAVEHAIRFGLAVGGSIAPRSIFARKNYFYPDLPKGYQISQYEIPVVSGGSLTFLVGDEEKTVRLTRAHLEEDAGKSIHGVGGGGAYGSAAGYGTAGGYGSGTKTGIDLNRAGTPLLEIVSEPDMRSSAEAVAYAKKLHALVQWIRICDGNMQEGSFRCDANVSVRRPGGPLGTRREIKNLNSFEFMQQAIEYEMQWQINEIEEGREIQQATVLFDSDKGETRAMRSKEDAHDYRYFPDPDLLPLEIKPEWIEEIKSGLPEMQGDMEKRFAQSYGLNTDEAELLTANLDIARYFENTVTALGTDSNWFANNQPTADFRFQKTLAPARLVFNWVMGEVSAMLNREGLNFNNCPVSPQTLAGVLCRIKDGTISNKIAKEVFEALWSTGDPQANWGVISATLPSMTAILAAVDAVIDDKGLKQITDTAAIEKIIDEVLAANQKSVEEFRAGKEKAFNALVGQAMKATKGKANPQQVNDLLRKKLGG